MAWKPLVVGKMRTQVRIETKTRVSNGQGGWTEQWTPVEAEIWAEKIPMRGDEVLRDSIVRSTSAARFVIRFREDVTPKHRLVEVASGKIWNIRAADDPYNRRDRIELTCESGVAT